MRNDTDHLMTIHGYPDNLSVSDDLLKEEASVLLPRVYSYVQLNDLNTKKLTTYL